MPLSLPPMLASQVEELAQQLREAKNKGSKADAAREAALSNVNAQALARVQAETALAASEAALGKSRAELAELVDARDEAEAAQRRASEEREAAAAAAAAAAGAAGKDAQARLDAAIGEAKTLRARAAEAEKGLADEKERSQKEKDQMAADLSERVRKVSEREAGMAASMAKVRSAGRSTAAALGKSL